MGRIPDELVDKILQENDIVEVVSEYVALKSSGRNFMGVCPFHSDKGPSLSVSREKQLYHCFGCGASGNVLGFIMNIKNIEFLDAIRYLGDRIGISIEQKDRDKDPNFKLRENMYKTNLEAARYFFDNLRKSQVGYNYLIKRGIKDKTIKKFGLGLGLSSWNYLEDYLIKKGFSKDILLKNGLIIKGKNGTYDRFRSRIMFPVFDLRGRVIGFGGRVIDNSKPKYLNSPESEIFLKGTNLYGMNFAIKDRVPNSIIIVEGYMDVISLSQEGITNVVASLGTALTESQAKLIKKYTDNVYVCYDSDVAGKAATIRGMEILKNVGCNVKVIIIPYGKDPDEFIRINGKEAFRKLIDEALHITDYKIMLAKEGLNLSNMEDRLKFTQKVVSILTYLSSEVELQHYVKKVSDETGIPSVSIIEDIRRNRKVSNNIKSPKKDNIVNDIKKEPAFKKSEQMLLTLCFNSKDYFQYIKGRISIEEYITPSYRLTAKLLYDMLEEGVKVIPNNILLKFNSANSINEVSKVFTNNIPQDITKKIIDDYIKVIKRHNIDEKIKNTQIQIKEWEKKGQKGKAAELANTLILLQSNKDY